jgi:protocatechuate 3,4-dioxygenase beta subunit
MAVDDGTRSELLADVVSRYDGMRDRRLQEVVTSAIRHLHAFVADVGLTHDEWMAGIRFLTEVGKTCDDVRQELILLSDTLGVSTLVERIDYDAAAGATENTELGPFYAPASPERAYGASTLEDPDDGDRVVVRGRVTGPSGTPISNAAVDVWQNSTSGFYAVQQPGVQHPDNLRGVFRTDADGRYELRSVRPVPYPIPGDGPVGALLAACGRDIMRAGHIHVMASAPGFKTLVTHVFDAASEHLDDDAVFGVRPSLIREFAPDEHGELAATFDIVLSPA